MIVEQCRAGERQVLAAAQGAVVVQGVGAYSEIGRRSQSPVVGQQASNGNGAVPATGDARNLRQLQLPGIQAQITPTTQSAIAAVQPGQPDVQATVAGDQAVVVPVHTTAGQAFGGQ
ncbi:hypothetical protein D3C77_158590 [compost metagenome]